MSAVLARGMLSKNTHWFLQALMKEGVDLERFSPAVFDEVLAGWQPLEEETSFDLSQDNVRRVLSLTSGSWVATSLAEIVV